MNNLELGDDRGADQRFDYDSEEEKENEENQEEEEGETGIFGNIL